jgi:hypothetical protein
LCLKNKADNKIKIREDLSDKIQAALDKGIKKLSPKRRKITATSSSLIKIET